MVCMGFKAGIIDERLLDPKYAFEDIEGVQGSGENDASSKIASLKRLIETNSKKKKAVGYSESDHAKNSLFNQADLMDFFNSVDPFEFLTKFNKVSDLPFYLTDFLIVVPY